MSNASDAPASLLPILCGCAAPPPPAAALLAPAVLSRTVAGAEYEVTEIAQIVGKRGLGQRGFGVGHRRDIFVPLTRQFDAVQLNNTRAFVATFVIGEAFLDR